MLSQCLVFLAASCVLFYEYNNNVDYSVCFRT